jgi:dihydropteroate synthase
MRYIRPILQTDPHRPVGAVTLAGGWCWFDQVEVLTRGAAPTLLPASALDTDTLARLAQPRADVAGLSMGAPQVMGILNVTPDSFSDGGRFDAVGAALEHATAMEADGATLIDVGGESTRPGAATVPIADEIARVVPAIAAIRQKSAVAISIDTRKAEVAAAAIAAGATLVNDVAALTFDPDLAGVTAQAKLPVCLMHAQGDPATMQNDPQYDDVLLDVYDFLADRVLAAEAAGIPRHRIVVDPGIGFGKTLAHNLTLLRGLALFHALGCPILLGASRKRFIGTLTGTTAADQRVAGSVAVAQWAVQQGVQILRVHDTLATKQAITLQMEVNSVTGAR